VLAAAHRLALAGAQDKIAVVRDMDGTLRLPRDGGFSTHILKPDSIRFPGLCELEVLGLWLASRVGLDVPPVELVEVANRRAMVIERFDRTAADEGALRVRQLHQEDFCQALGYPSELKYELRGGPSLAGISHLVREMDLGGAAIQGVLDWVIFCAVIGNADAHAKNLAILSDRDGRRGLASFYDLVPTVVMSERRADRAPALRIGSAQRIDAIEAVDWRAFAGDAGYDPAFVLQRVESMATSVLDALNEVGNALISSGADPTRIRERALPALARNAAQILFAVRK
jgi:serine/threonine-protein kinase HipA